MTSVRSHLLAEHFGQSPELGQVQGRVDISDAALDRWEASQKRQLSIAVALVAACCKSALGVRIYIARLRLVGPDPRYAPGGISAGNGAEFVVSRKRRQV